MEWVSESLNIFENLKLSMQSHSISLAHR